MRSPLVTALFMYVWETWAAPVSPDDHCTNCPGGGVTARPVDPLIDPEVAWMVVLPVVTPVAKPVLLIVATAVLVDVQPTELVRFCWIPSLYVPVAVNCCVAPLAIDGFAGVTAIDTKVGAGVTVRPVDPLIEPEAA